MIKVTRGISQFLYIQSCPAKLLTNIYVVEDPSEFRFLGYVQGATKLSK